MRASRRRALPAWLALAFVVVAPAAANPYRIDTQRSSIRFLVPYDFMIVGLVEGEFHDFSGRAVMDEGAMERSSIAVEIRTASLDTELAARDLGLKSELFLAADEHPTIRFGGDRVEASDGAWELVGTLRIRDVEREIRVPFELLDFGEVKVALGRAQVSRQAFGIEGPLPSPEFDIGDTVTIFLHLTLVPASG